MKKILNIIVPVFICFLVGMIAGHIQSDAIQTWYPTLNKPSVTPPNFVFPIAWSIIYLMSGISIGLILNHKTSEKGNIVSLFAAQLIFNFLWSVVFFYLQSPLLGLIDILILDALVVWYAMKTYPVLRVSSLLFIPYILWLGLATYLNLYIYLNN